MLYTKEIAEILEKSLATFDVKSLEEGGTFKVVATDETIDRDGDILTLDGWDVENYLKNPVILANHTYSIENIIGKATNIYAENNQIIVEGVFSKTNPLGILAQALYNEGMLKTVSVGFIGKERNGIMITKKELLELSFVAVPANPSAVSLDGKTFEEAVQKGLIIEEKSEESEESEVTVEPTELQEIKSMLTEVITSFDEIKSIVKTLADDKAEEKASEQVRKQAQELVNAVSGYLRDQKRAK